MTASNLADAQRLAADGWPVFPGYLDDQGRKVPIGTLVEHGFKDASTHARKIAMWWRVRPDALIGVALPVGTMALDVDDVEKFTAAGLDVPDAPEQQTPSGGYHRFYRTDGRPVRQTVKEVPGADTRVGGKGYVIAWVPDAFPRPEDLPDAPEWLYASQSESENETDPAADADLLIGEDGATHRDQLVTYAGRLRWAGSTAKEILAALQQAKSDGRIVDGDEAWPWTDKDFTQIAKDIGSKPGPEKAPVITVNMVPHQKPPRPEPTRQTAAELMEEKLRPMEYLLPVIFPEGLGVVAGAPKVGKSWLTFQAALEISTGGSLLGQQAAEERPVLYYGLEDGKRRFQKRLEVLIGGRDLDLGLLELRYDAPVIGQGLEDDIKRWLDDNERGAVFVDVLAKVRPVSKGKANAYDEDYGVIGPLQSISRDRPGSALVVVTHDRKAGSDDFLTTVTGTRGITGAADWIWVVKRERLKVQGTINVVGRDIEQDMAINANFTGMWTLDNAGRHGKSSAQDEVLDALRTEGDLTASETADYLHPDDLGSSDYQNMASKKLNGLEEQGLVKRVGRRPGRGGAVVFHVVSEEERIEEVARAREQAVRAMPSNGGLAVRRVSRAPARLPAREGPPSQVSQVSQEASETLDSGKLGKPVESSLAPKRVTRAPAHTRGTLR